MRGWRAPRPLQLISTRACAAPRRRRCQEGRPIAIGPSHRTGAGRDIDRGRPRLTRASDLLEIASSLPQGTDIHARSLSGLVLASLAACAGPACAARTLPTLVSSREIRRVPPPDRTPPARRLTLLGFLLATLCRVACADPSVPWTPTVASRHALELLVDESGLALPLTHWPLPRAAVKRALDALPRELPPALDAARERVAAELRAAERPALSLASARAG